MRMHYPSYALFNIYIIFTYDKLHRIPEALLVLFVYMKQKQYQTKFSF